MSSSPARLNLGCGAFRIPGAFGVDRVQRGSTDVVADLSAGLPFRSGCVEAVHIYHVMEHLDFVRLMDELHRVLGDGGRLHIRVPHASSFGFWDDPTHVRPFTSRTFDYWEPGYHQEYGFKTRFNVLNRRLHFLGNTDINCFKVLPWLTNPLCAMINRLANAHIRFCERLWAHYVGGFGEIEFELRKA
jgi:SAM-dependent methyltransferase